MCDKIITKHKPDPWLSRTGHTWDGESNAIHELGEGDKLEHRIQEADHVNGLQVPAPQQNV